MNNDFKNKIENNIGEIRKGQAGPPMMPQQLPDELRHAQMIVQHAQSILSDLLRGGSSVDHTVGDNMVGVAFSIADAFDTEFQKRMRTAAESVSKRPLVQI